MGGFARSIFAEYTSSAGLDNLQLINRREESVLFESNRSLFLPNGSLFNSTPQATSSILSNINLLRSHGISPEEYSARLDSLYTNQPRDSYYTKYSALASIYSLFDHFLHDAGFLTESDLFARIATDDILLDTIASRTPHLFLLNLESFTPVHCQFLSALLHRSSIQSGLLTLHDSLTRSDLREMAELYFEGIPMILVQPSSSSSMQGKIVIIHFEIK